MPSRPWLVFWVGVILLLEGVWTAFKALGLWHRSSVDLSALVPAGLFLVAGLLWHFWPRAGLTRVLGAISLILLLLGALLGIPSVFWMSEIRESAGAGRFSTSEFEMVLGQSLVWAALFAFLTFNFLFGRSARAYFVPQPPAVHQR